MLKVKVSSIRRTKQVIRSRLQIQIPTFQSVPSMGPIVPAVTLDSRQNAIEKSRPVNIQHLIHWGWIDIECAVNCGNKIEFSFGVNKVGFC